MTAPAAQAGLPSRSRAFSGGLCDTSDLSVRSHLPRTQVTQ
jgi:hypothetical protein